MEDIKEVNKALKVLDKITYTSKVTAECGAVL
jgi:hypothetical protein